MNQNNHFAFEACASAGDGGDAQACWLLPPARRVSTRRPTRGASARTTAQPRREPSGVRGARQPRKELSPWGVRAEPSRGWAERPVEADRLSDVRIQ